MIIILRNLNILLALILFALSAEFRGDNYCLVSEQNEKICSIYLEIQQTNVCSFLEDIFGKLNRFKCKIDKINEINYQIFKNFLNEAIYCKKNNNCSDFASKKAEFFMKAIKSKCSNLKPKLSNLKSLENVNFCVMQKPTNFLIASTFKKSRLNEEILKLLQEVVELTCVSTKSGDSLKKPAKDKDPKNPASKNENPKNHASKNENSKNHASKNKNPKNHASKIAFENPRIQIALAILILFLVLAFGIVYINHRLNRG